MQDVFITEIHIGRVRHLRDLDITLSGSERKHLVLTGKNGSGKTSLLEAMRNSVILQQRISHLNLDEDTRAKYVSKGILDRPEIVISYSQSDADYKDVTHIYIPATRSKLAIPNSIETVNIEEKTLIARNQSRNFLKYILNLDYQLYGAKSNQDTIVVERLEKWFGNFIMALRDIYNCQELKLQRDAKNLVFNIEMPGRELFGLHEMADGYAAFLNIYMELLMCFEKADAEVEYDQPAIVMVDEIETHLHVELQKRILPFLTKMFPKVQFIVTTHSPFVINSLENAVIYDLEEKERLDNPSFYSYEAIVESFLGTDMYSNQLKGYFERYSELCFKERTEEENEEFLRAKAELEIRSIPSTKLYIAFKNLEGQRKADKNGSSI